LKVVFSQHIIALDVACGKGLPGLLLVIVAHQLDIQQYARPFHLLRWRHQHARAIDIAQRPVIHAHRHREDRNDHDQYQEQRQADHREDKALAFHMPQIFICEHPPKLHHFRAPSPCTI
jgi:hypothetical protein